MIRWIAAKRTDGVAFSATAQAFDVDNADGSHGTLANAALAWAWRPLGSRWSLLDRLEFRFEAFNATNTPSFGNPGTSLGSATFGQINSTKATNRELSGGLKSHLEETKKQIERLEQVFEKLGEKPKATDCPAMDGIIEEADEIAGNVADKEVLDAAIIAAAQAVEHYEITRYGTLIAWAESLGHDELVRLLNTNLNEEKAADKKLTTIAERRGVNQKAAS